MRGHLLRAAQKSDTNALAYIAAVEAADGQALEANVKIAINAFVVGCKDDGIWNAIKASCILAGARSLAGALVPLVGTAPTNSNFVSGDYNRKTGLVGNGSSKYINSNRNNNADPQNSRHFSLYASVISSTAGGWYMGSGNGTGNSNFVSRSATSIGQRLSGDSVDISGVNGTGFIGINRNNSTSVTGRGNSQNVVVTAASVSPTTSSITVFGNVSTGYSSAKLQFYSIGESIDLALLDARVTNLINAYASAIP